MIINVKRYAAVYVLATVCLISTNVVLAMLFQFVLPAGLTTIVPAVVAAQFEGQRMAKNGLQDLQSGAAWKASLLMTSVALIVVLLLAVFVLSVPSFREILEAIAPSMLGLLVGGALIVTLVVNRAVLDFSFRSARREIIRRTTQSQDNG